VSFSKNIFRFSLILGAAMLGWLSFAYAATMVVRERNPSLALSLVSNDAIAITKVIDPKILFASSPSDIARTRASVRMAIKKQAISPSAVNMLALTNYADGKINEANIALRLSEKLSRREIPVQVGLIQNSVLRDNAAQALRHYDTALRTSPAAQESLFPFMVAASGERVLLPAFTKILARGPEWRYPFYAALIEKTPSRENVALLYQALIGTPGAFHEEAAADLINRLANDKNYGLAYSVYVKAAPDAVKNPFIFNRSSRFQPFDWVFFDNPAAGAFLASKDNKGRGTVSLFYRADASQDETVARKLVTLPAGRYRIRAEAQSDQDSGKALIYWSIKCAEGPVLSDIDNRNGTSVDFAVPVASCGAQIIDLKVSSDVQAVSGQIDKVILLRL
jgi:hypothetical protein